MWVDVAILGLARSLRSPSPSPSLFSPSNTNIELRSIKGVNPKVLSLMLRELGENPNSRRTERVEMNSE